MGGALQIGPDCLQLLLLLLAVLARDPQLLKLDSYSFWHLLLNSVLVCAHFPSLTETVSIYWFLVLKELKY